MKKIKKEWRHTMNASPNTTGKEYSRPPNSTRHMGKKTDRMLFQTFKKEIMKTLNVTKDNNKIKDL
jgi:hypothetical protein